jgi:hypothetical protein
MTPIEELDAVLQMVYKQKDYIKKGSLQYFFGPEKGVNQISPTNFDQILLKLIKEGYIHEIFPSDNPQYSITFEGRLLLEKGGYVALYKSLDAETNYKISERKRIELNENISRKSAKLLNILTGLLAIGTFALLAWDMYKYIHPRP